jgi:hypothetical protein
MTESASRASHGELTPVDGHADANPEVRYERSDVEPRGVVTFVVGLSVVIVLSGVMLVWLFRHYERRAASADARAALPLTKGERDRLPSSPRLEGIDPTEDVGRAWPGATRTEGPLPWFGYNVRVVPADGPREAGTDAEERDRRAALAMQKKLQRVNEELAKMAGTLAVRPGSSAVPADLLRRSAGEANSGRAAGGKEP